MNFTKFLLIITVGISLNNHAFNMNNDDNKKRKNEFKENSNNKKTEYFDTEKSFELRKEMENSNNESLKTIKMLLENNANPNVSISRGMSPLLYECSKETPSLEIIKTLLTYKANPNHVNDFDMTPLYTFFIFCDGNPKKLSPFSIPFILIETLLEKKADPNIQPTKSSNNFFYKKGKQLTPLHIACSQDHPSCKLIEILIKNNADPKIQDSNQNTPLHMLPLINLRTIHPIKSFFSTILKTKNHIDPINIEKSFQEFCKENNHFKKIMITSLLIFKTTQKIPKYIKFEILGHVLIPYKAIETMKSVLSLKNKHNQTILMLTKTVKEEKYESPSLYTENVLQQAIEFFEILEQMLCNKEFNKIDYKMLNEYLEKK